MRESRRGGKGAGLVELARRYVTLSDELETVRSEIARAVLNGGGGKPDPHPTGAQRPGVKGSQSSHPNAAKAAEAEETILNLLRERPMRMVEIMAAMESRQSTTSERLRRLRQRGLVAADSGAWTATA